MDFEEWIKKEHPRNWMRSDIIDIAWMQKAWQASAEAHKPRWIPIEERKPIKYGYYPCLTLNLEFWVSRVFDIDKNEFISYDNDFVTHWLELPEMPE